MQGCLPALPARDGEGLQVKILVYFVGGKRAAFVPRGAVTFRTDAGGNQDA